MKVFQLSTVLFFLTTILYFSQSREYKKSNTTLKATQVVSNERIAKDSILINDVSEKLLRYMVISFEQGEIIDMFQSSRNEKNSRKELLNLMVE